MIFVSRVKPSGPKDRPDDCFLDSQITDTNNGGPIYVSRC